MAASVICPVDLYLVLAFSSRLFRLSYRTSVWLAFAAGCLLIMGASSLATFNVYAADLKLAFGYDQVQGEFPSHTFPLLYTTPSQSDLKAQFDSTLCLPQKWHVLFCEKDGAAVIIASKITW